MIDDESEPSLFRDFETNISSDSSELTYTDPDEEQSTTKLERKTSISLYNVSSTPHTFKPLKKCRFRTGSHYQIDTDFENKPKRKKYDHIESKVKQYRNEIREQSNKRRNIRQQQEDEIRNELENNLRVYDRKNNSIKFLPNVILNEDLNLSHLSPIVNSNDENDFIESGELKEKYNEALSEIENLQIEITKLKAAKSVTPRINRRKSLQSTSMIKTCLFRNSSSALRQNGVQNNTLFGGDSTCRTIDIEDLMSPKINHTQNHQNNPFIIKSPCLSPTPDSITNSSASLLFDFQTRTRRSSVYNFFNNFIKCPTMSFLQKLKFDKNNNKVAPIPCVIITSPSNREKNEFVRKNYFEDINNVVLDSPKQELLLKEMTECCEELTEKINRFKQLVNDYLYKNINNNN